jgi:hypothetical protein
MNIDDYFNSLIETFDNIGNLDYIIRYNNIYYMVYWEKAKWNLSTPIKYIDTNNELLSNDLLSVSSKSYGEDGVGLTSEQIDNII